MIKTKTFRILKFDHLNLFRISNFEFRISVAATPRCGRLSLINTKPFIIPIFLPQWGCPHRCIYCHQERITQTRRQKILREDFSTLVESGLNSGRRTPGRRVELAFYGGTFTLLPDPLQKELLDWAAHYVEQGRVEAIRLSTRPDALSEEVLLKVKAAGVETVELGIQSLNDEALERSGRGHSAQDSFKAVRLLKEFSLGVGIQLMVGLPGDTPEGFHQTIREVRDLQPDLVRIYPTVVFPETVLAHWVKNGLYTPLALEEAVSLCCEAVDLLETAGIPVIRLGLQSHDRMIPGKTISGRPLSPGFRRPGPREIVFEEDQAGFGRTEIFPGGRSRTTGGKTGYRFPDRK